MSPHFSVLIDIVFIKVLEVKYMYKEYITFFHFVNKYFKQISNFIGLHNMADIIKISQLLESGVVATDDLLEVSINNQNGTYTSRKLQVSTLLALVNSQLPTSGNFGMINILDYVNNTDATVDQTANVQAAFNAAAATGGQVIIPSGTEILCLSDVTLASHCDILGFSKLTENAFDVTSLESGLVFADGASLVMELGSTITAVRVRSQSVREATDFTDPSSFFTGTGIKINNTDVSIISCSVFGFTNGIISTGPTGRTTITDMKADNINSINLDNSEDVSRLTNVQIWPFCGGAGSLAIRDGIGITLQNNGDWTHLTNCFTWGVTVGFKLNDVRSNVSFTACGSDFPSFTEPSTGIDIEGDCGTVDIIGSRIELVETGIHLNYTPSVDNIGSVNIIGCTISRFSQGILITQGDAKIIGCTIIGERDGNENLNGLLEGVKIIDTTAFVTVSENLFENIVAVGSKAIEQDGVPTGSRTLDRNHLKNVTDSGDDNSDQESNMLTAIGVVKGTATDPDVIALCQAFEDNYFKNT